MIDRNSFEPLYLQVKNDIIASIESGKIRIGDKLMSENEMLQYYGVGRMTIRSALSELVAEGCLKKEQGLGSFCIAYPKKTRRLNIDVLINSEDAYFAPAILKGISRVLEKNACNLLMHDTKNSRKHICDLLEDILSKGTDGVLLQPTPLQELDISDIRPTLEKYQRASIPLVTICGKIPTMAFPSLTVDDYQGACLASQHLLDCGHRNILGLFSGMNFGSTLRLEGFLNTLAQTPDAKSFVINTVSPYADEVVRMVSEKKVTAILCYNDWLAVECMQLLVERGFRIPEDVSLIGYDNTDLSLGTIPKLSTISHPKGRLGSDAAQMLLNMLETMTTPKSVVYRPELVVRCSVQDLSQVQ